MNAAHPATAISSLADYARHAEHVIESAYWRYLQAGAAEETTLRDNRAAMAAWQIVPRVLADVRGGNTAVTLFGQTLEHPFLLAPIAYQGLFHAEGETASVAAADALGGLAVISSLASQPFAAIVHGCEQSHWFQLYWQGSRERTLTLLQRAQAAGCRGVVFTADAPVKQAALALPAGVRAVNLDTEISPAVAANASEVFDGWMQLAPTWDDLAWLRSHVSGPLLLKGVLHADDARQAVACGCDGVVVSNHGGRVLDGAPASLDVLPEVVRAVGPDFPVLFDSGIRSGRDAFRALALGARAVLVGRPYIWGLASAGAMGVAHVIRLLRDELEMTMALAGCRELAAISPACLRRARGLDTFAHEGGAAVDQA